MAEPAYDAATKGAAKETEISERSSELVLPDDPVSCFPEQTIVNGSETIGPERKNGLSDPAAPSSETIPTGATADSTRGSAPERRGASLGGGLVESAATGTALPGDRGPRDQPSQNQRPSFWRRIALGGRRIQNAGEATAHAHSRAESRAESRPERRGETRDGPEQSIVLAQSHTTVINPANVENRIVEPMLQALVSVEAKLERSHVELAGRSEKVEQRLTQLWDIEEQLGTLKELQESLLEMSAQQHRLESALRNQTQTLRWLIAAIFFTLAGAAFVVAALLP